MLLTLRQEIIPLNISSPGHKTGRPAILYYRKVHNSFLALITYIDTAYKHAINWRGKIQDKRPLMYLQKRFSFGLYTVLLLLNAPFIKAQVAPITPPEQQLKQPFGDQDRSAFLKPDKVYYPETWFHFIGGNVSKKGITADLEAISAAGTSGITLFHGQFGGAWPKVDTQITCLSPLWEDAVKHAALEARRLGLRFNMENCPGWAMAGGPWIKPADAMRALVSSRTDITGGKGRLNVKLPKPQPSNEPWRDYQEISVLAFPTPLDDNGDTLKVSSGNSPKWQALFAGKAKDGVSLEQSTKEKPNTFEITFAKDETVRTLELPRITSFNYPYTYEPAVNIKIDAILPNGTSTEILNSDLPESNFQDDVPLSLACIKDVRAKKFRVSITNKHAIKVEFMHFLTAARENNWEAEAAWVLRGVGRSDQKFAQDKRTYVDPVQVKDISGYLQPDGTLTWDAPAGKWTILRIGHVNAGKKNGPAPPEGTGWECDKLSARGADAHFAGYIGRLSGNSGPLNNGLLTGMLMDSWECESQTWTADLEAQFAQHAGYRSKMWLPALFGYVLKDQETTFRFLHDWKSTINYLFVNNFYGRMTALAKQNNLSVAYETAAGDTFPGDIMEYYKFADVPMCEFWQPMSPSFVGSLNFKPIKPCASAARLYGKPRIAAEAFTSFDLTWDEQWQMLKEVANVNMVEGVTHLVYHTFTHNPQTDFLPPGTSFGSNIGTPFLRQQTWWKHMPYLNAYFARCSYLLERGRPVSDVLWYLGDEIDHKPDQNAPFPAGFKFDYCNPDVLLNRLSVDHGMLVTPEGLKYKVLWLPATTHMLPQTLEKINALIHAGATVIGNAPENIVTLTGGKNARLRFDVAVKDIWGAKSAKGLHAVGKGIVVSGLSLTDALHQLHLTSDVAGDNAIWVHRNIEGADWYFVSSPKGKAFKGPLDFRTTGTAETWDPVTGNIQPVAAQVKDGRSIISFDLPQAGSCFVVFRHNGKSPVNALKPAIKQLVASSNISTNWQLEFPAGWGAPAAMQIDSLKPWKDLGLTAEGKAFSGSATYTTTFNVDKLNPNNAFILNLGQVAMIAKVTVNGKDMGTLWATPYQTDITKALVPGKNTLKVEVTSTWFNRLVFDANQPEDKRKTWTISGPDKTSQLRASGLLGPVVLNEEKLSE